MATIVLNVTKPMLILFLDFLDSFDSKTTLLLFILLVLESKTVRLFLESQKKNSMIYMREKMRNIRIFVLRIYLQSISFESKFT